MRKLTRMAAIGSVGLLALTACGDDESDEAQEPTDEQTEAAAEGGAELSADRVTELVEQEGHDATCEDPLPEAVGSYVLCTDNESDQQIYVIVREDELLIERLAEAKSPDDPTLSEYEGDPADPSNWDDDDSGEAVDEDQ